MIKPLLHWLRSLFQHEPVDIPTDHRHKEKAVTKTPIEEERVVPRKETQIRETVLLNVGLDYGTSSTKIIIRDILKKKIYVVFLDEPCERLPKFAIPSTVTLHEDRLYFGTTGENISGGRKFNSLKICLACQLNLVPCRKCLHSTANGLFLVPRSRGMALELSSEVLVAAYLAWVIQNVYSWVDKMFSGFNTSVTFNVSVPLEHVDTTGIESRYNYVFYIAEILNKKVRQGIETKEWLEFYQGARVKYPTLPGMAERNVFVQPETVAAVMPYTRPITADEGLYAVIDIGAGTTDISFFRLGSFMPRRLSFYATKTFPIGGDNLDLEIGEWMKDLLTDSGICVDGQDSLSELARPAKHALQANEIFSFQYSGNKFELTRDSMEIACQDSFKQIYNAYENTWMIAFQKEEIQTRWNKFRIVFLGGGARPQAIQRRLVYPLRPFIEVIEPVETVPYENFDVSDPSLAENVEKNIDLLAVAYGLSFPQTEFENVRRPSSVGPLEKPEPLPEMPDRDELYPK